ncbi:hypothetical protein BDW22DRAFT_1350299 [Trametopsis cervina]|nr:hypothetical protein BDW22DRAFT_1350299 [Trametopsis cervina]
MSTISWAVRLNNHFQKLGTLYTLNTVEERRGDMWTCAYKVNGEVKGQASAPTKHDAKEAAALQALQALGVVV